MLGKEDVQAEDIDYKTALIKEMMKPEALLEVCCSTTYIGALVGLVSD